VVAGGDVAAACRLPGMPSAVTGKAAEGGRETAWLAARGDFRTDRLRVDRFFECARASLDVLTFRGAGHQLIVLNCVSASARAFRACSRFASALSLFFFARLANNLASFRRRFAWPNCSLASFHELSAAVTRMRSNSIWLINLRPAPSSCLTWRAEVSFVLLVEAFISLSRESGVRLF
jgi:hypothetical protein